MTTPHTEATWRRRVAGVRRSGEQLSGARDAGPGAVAAVAVGLVRALRARESRSAWVGATRVATSDDVVVVEGNAYFPRAAIGPDVLVPSSTTTVCPWKGVARYYTVRVGGAELPDAAWSYPHPLPFARRVEGRVAFEPVVDVRGPV